MNARETTRHTYRVGLFTRRGLSPDAATLLADRLVSRDAERDDRRMCIECSHLQITKNLRIGNRCFQAAQGRLRGTSVHHDPVLTILQRCEGFAFQTP